MNLKGAQITYSLVCTDGREEIQVGLLYNLLLRSKSNKHFHIKTSDLDKLPGEFSAVKVKGIS